MRALHAEEAVREERDEATRRAEIAQAVNDFLNEDLLASVAPSVQRGRGQDVKMRDVLDQASRSIDREAQPGGKFFDKPLVEAAIRYALGETYHRLGEEEKASGHLRRTGSFASRNWENRRTRPWTPWRRLPRLCVSRGICRNRKRC